MPLNLGLHFPLLWRLEPLQGRVVRSHLELGDGIAGLRRFRYIHSILDAYDIQFLLNSADLCLDSSPFRAPVSRLSAMLLRLLLGIAGLCRASSSNACFRPFGNWHDLELVRLRLRL